MQHHKPGGLAVLGIQQTFKFVDGPEKQGAFNHVHGDALRQFGGAFAQQRIALVEPVHTWVGSLVNKQREGKQHTYEDGFFKIKQQSGQKGDEQHGPVHAGCHNAQADSVNIYHLEGNEQQYAAQGGERQPAYEWGQHKQQRQGENAGKHRAHARSAAGCDHKGATGKGAAAGNARGKASGDIAEALTDKLLAAVKRITLDVCQLFANGQ